MAEVTLETRIERLERQNHRLKVGMLAFAAVVAGFVCLAATEPVTNVVRAKRFELVNSEGKLRGVIAVQGTAEVSYLQFQTGDDFIRKVTLNTRQLRFSDRDTGLVGFYEAKGVRIYKNTVLRGVLGSINADTETKYRTVGQHPLASVVLLDDNEKVIWKAPSAP